MTFQKILEKYRKYSFSERDKGARFERLMQAYLLTDPTYANLFKKVWLWTEFFGKADLGGKDTGIDLVALTLDGDYWAIQCKCYQEDTVIDKPEVDTFLSISSREFRDKDLNTTRFRHRLFISTTNKWGANATEAIKNQIPTVSRLNLYDLQQAPVDWAKLDKNISGEEARIAKRTLWPHQQTALEKTNHYFKKNNRGKLIMACGTGKTLNSLRIAEKETKGKGLVLFMVPSIALLGQTLREWYANADEPINAICICSDPEISKKSTKNDDSDSVSVVDLALPASTNVKDIVMQYDHIRNTRKKGMTVFFSTYQSIDVTAKAQKAIQKRYNDAVEFDLIICDEAHRTTGVTLSNDDVSSFVKVHDNGFIKAKKRLYMTATPRLYTDDAKGKAAQAEAVLCSMDDEKLYGEEIYRIGFGEAVERGLLTDYKVLILTLSDKDVPPAIQKMIADKNEEIDTNDASKLIGCINALSKQVLGDEGSITGSDPEPMRSAVAFCQNIAISKKITATFNQMADTYLSALPREKMEKMVAVKARHIDGTMAAPVRDEMLGWLKEEKPDNNECRILTNVRCLSEGVDVPSLDAVMFLSARNSQVDVVQSVGRVMRKAPGKKYGYIIIPVVVPSDIEPDKALNDNERYRVVWTVLNALRAHDDRFNATVNKIELNKKRPTQILVGGTAVTYDDNGSPVVREDAPIYSGSNERFRQMALEFTQIQNAVFARMVQKVGDRRYWEQWARNVAEIAERQVILINRLVKTEGSHKKAFENFLQGLRKNINPSISSQEAVEMLAQHIITKPVFDALFEGYSFVKNNPISVSMQKMLEILQAQAIEKDLAILDKFYDSVRKRAEGIDNAEGKQRIIIELYDKFFKTAFPKMVEKLGIVYTPVEVVDFIIHSVDAVLKKEFGRGLTDENVHILDPFTGTGTFITRLLQSGLIQKNDLRRKYESEIHANEIVLLAYYIAAVNIENAYHDASDEVVYRSFDGICLTDTFQLGETDDGSKLFAEMFPKNSERVARQKKAPVKVIFGNPPYSIGQKSANDNAANQSYPKLEERIASTYAAESSAGLNKSLYDAYIKAFRWSTDRLDSKTGGIICFVSNGAWLDGNSTDGFRKCLEREFDRIYVFNLRGNQRTSGELSRQEGGKIFGSGSRTPIAITLLVRNNDRKKEKSDIYYYDIGDYLSREDKLAIINNNRDILNIKSDLKKIYPNKYGDWIGKRNEIFDTFVAIEPQKKFDRNSRSIFVTYAIGISTNRDSWVYNYSKVKIESNMKNMIHSYGEQLKKLDKERSEGNILNIELFIEKNPRKISWTRALKNDLKNRIAHKFEKGNIRLTIYRPFSKQHLYFDRNFNESPGLNHQLYPNHSYKNLTIIVTGIGSTKPFSVLMVDCLSSLDTLEKSQNFPLFYYEEKVDSAYNLFDDQSKDDFVRRNSISEFAYNMSTKIYGSRVTREDIFYYVYGLLHSKEYRETFQSDLKKNLPKIPFLDDPMDFWHFSKAGRELAELHLNYEKISPHPDVIVHGEKSGHFKVEKMRFPEKGKKDTIIYNSVITLTDIPLKAYDYVINGKSAIEWIMERYQISKHKESGIVNDPNDWSEESGNPRYILDLLLSIINVSVKTVEIVEKLPKLKWE